MLRIDHVVLAVPDLDAAGTRILNEVGLGSLPGGRHPGWGTGNRVVPVGHEYVELLAVVDPVEAESSDVGRWISNASRSGDRFVAWCVSTDEIEEVAERLGLAVATGSRSLPEGGTLRWRSAGLDRVAERPDLPFFISWDGPPELHPGRAQARHRVEPNGIAWIEVAGDHGRLQGWLGGGDVPVRVVGGDTGVRAVGISTDRGEIVLR
ncbi:MAG: VOC family protein [Actinomycetota bacterium]